MSNMHMSRGKRLTNDKWYIGYFTVSGADNAHFIRDHDDFPYQVDPDTIGKCTGLPAKESYRGKVPIDLLVFEGDLLKRDRCDMVFTVIWDAGGGRFLCVAKGSPDNYLMYVSDELHKYATIIGNIHDNPELLEVQND